MRLETYNELESHFSLFQYLIVVCHLMMAVLVAIIVTLLFLFQDSGEALSRYPTHNEDRQGVVRSQDTQPRPFSLYFLNLNKDYKRTHQINLDKQMNVEPFISRSYEHSFNPNDDSNDCDLTRNTNHQTFDPTAFYNTNLRQGWLITDEIDECEKNCTTYIASTCYQCVEETVEALSFSCKRTCRLPKGDSVYLHEASLEASPSEQCKKRVNRCCKHNCFKRIFEACTREKMKDNGEKKIMTICSENTIEVLKGSCHNKCDRGSDNPYLKAFCSFAQSKKKQSTIKPFFMHFWN